MKIYNIDQKKTGIILTYTSQCVSIFTTLFYTPLILRLLGQSEYGLYQLVHSVVSYLNVLGFGFAGSYVRFYSRSKADQNENQIAKLNGMYLIIFIVISIVCIVCGNVMIVNIESIFSNGLTSKEYMVAKKLMFLMIINLALTFPNSVFDSIISAHERFVFQKGIMVLQNFITPFLMLPVLFWGYGSVGMVCITTALTITRLGLNIHFCIHKLHAHFSFRSFDFRLLKEMWIFTFFIFVNMIVDQINWNVDKLLIGRIIGTGAVAVYGIGNQINTLYLQLSVAISNVFVPKVNRIVVESDNNEELTKLFSRVGRIQFLILSTVLYVFSFIGRDFIRLWAGEGYEEAYMVALLLIIPVTVPLIQNLGIEIQRAKNKHKTRSVVYFFIALLNVVISIPLLLRGGIVGAATGTAISLLIGNGFFMNWYYQKRIGLDILYFWREIFKLMPAITVAMLIGMIINKFIKITGLTSLVLCAVLYAAIFTIILWHIGLNKDERKLIKKPVH